MRGGESLRDQLREAIETCDVCIFLATKQSTPSSWCSAELGAFWGARKKVIVYIADATLSDKDLPEQFKGDIWHRKIRDLVAEVKTTLMDAESTRLKTVQKSDTSPRVGEVSVPVFLNLIREILVTKAGEPVLSATMDALGETLKNVSKQRATGTSADVISTLQLYLSRLIGDSTLLLKSYGKGRWDYTFVVETTTGHWVGYCGDNHSAAGGDVDVYSGTLLLHLKSSRITACVVLDNLVENNIGGTEYQVGSILAHLGSPELGVVKGISAFTVIENS